MGLKGHVFQTVEGMKPNVTAKPQAIAEEVFPSVLPTIAGYLEQVCAQWPYFEGG